MKGRWLVGCALLAGCIPQYSTPRIDPPTAAFRGIASYLLTAPRVKVVFVHGMCTHTVKDWIDDRWDEQIRKTLAAELGARDEATTRAAAPYFVVKRVYAAGDRELDARFVMWSNSTADQKSRLAFDYPPPVGEFTWKRARVNASIKEGLVNDCLSDPMIYSGQDRERLKSMMKSALCEAVDLRLDHATQGCRPAAGAAPMNQPILVVTESLASKMVFDAMLELGRGASRSAAFERTLASIPQVYMLANQLPLLELAAPAEPAQEGARSVSPVGAGTTGEVIELLLHSRQGEESPGEGRGTVSSTEISIVAFTDPNDLLSYRLPARGWPQGVTVANVLDSNAGSLLGFLVEDPRAAHSGYHQNADVMKLVLCGSDQEDCATLRAEADK